MSVPAVAEILEIAEPRCDGDLCRDKVASLLARYLPSARPEHVGSMSVPGCVGKGDIDSLVRVPAAEFARSRETLDRLLPRGTANEPTESYAEYAWAESGSCASVHLVAVDGTHDDSHRFKALLLADAGLVQRYNALKLRYRGRQMDDYRAVKSEFIRHPLPGWRGRRMIPANKHIDRDAAERRGSRARRPPHTNRRER